MTKKLIAQSDNWSKHTQDKNIHTQILATSKRSRVDGHNYPQIQMHTQSRGIFYSE